jgi:hypothetical protein
MVKSMRLKIPGAWAPYGAALWALSFSVIHVLWAAGWYVISSWVTPDLQRCYQVMECEDPRLLQQWVERWKDIVDFEVIPVVTSAEAAAAVASRL